MTISRNVSLTTLISEYSSLSSKVSFISLWNLMIKFVMQFLWYTTSAVKMSPTVLRRMHLAIGLFLLNLTGERKCFGHQVSQMQSFWASPWQLIQPPNLLQAGSNATQYKWESIVINLFAQVHGWIGLEELESIYFLKSNHSYFI